MKDALERIKQASVQLETAKQCAAITAQEIAQAHRTTRKMQKAATKKRRFGKKD